MLAVDRVIMITVKLGHGIDSSRNERPELLLPCAYEFDGVSSARSVP
jgi:hypothetical protein